MSEWIEASAPSNIALIKYMGKSDVSQNRPTNPSLSWTLEKLRTFVRLRKDSSLTADQWSAFIRDDLRPIELSDKGRSKFLNFFSDLKREFRLQGFYHIESANNFPSDCGLASSASSFAALTVCAHEAFIKNEQEKSQSAKVIPYRAKELSRISQKGSGSSCRSFFSPWSMWHDSATGGGAEEVQLPYKNLLHMVVMCDESIKTVSSSEAHKKVLTSDLFKGRPERASDRLQNLIQSLRSENWKSVFEICWNEFWDMHVLFHTSKPSFMYMNGQSTEVLAQVQKDWHKLNDGPLVTMDAGSNVHLLFRESQTDLYKANVLYFNKSYNLWTDDGYMQKAKN